MKIMANRRTVTMQHLIIKYAVIIIQLSVSLLIMLNTSICHYYLKKLTH